MTQAEIKAYRQEFYDALVEITEGCGGGLEREKEIEVYRDVAFNSEDSYIEDFASHNTPREAAELYTM